MTRSYTGTITCSPSSGTATITSNTKTFASSFTFSGAGTVNFGDTFSTTQSFSHTAGTLDQNSKSVTMASFTTSGTTSRTLVLSNTNNFTCSAFNYTGSGLTLTENQSTLIITGSGAVSSSGAFAGNGETFYNVTFNSLSGILASMTGTNTFNDLTFTGSNNNTGGYLFGANQTINGNFTCNGNSAIQRLWIMSDTLGTQRTLTCNGTVTLSNCDFTDIVGAGTGTWSGTSVGNAGNNSGITFTSPTTCTWTGGTGNANASGEWSGGIIPICHDSVVFDAGSFSADGQTVTWNLRHLPACTFADTDQTFNLAFSQDTYIFGTQTWDANMTLSGTARTLLFYNRSAANFTPVVSCPHRINIYSHDTTVTLQGNLTNTYSTFGLNFFNGTFDANDNNINAVKIFLTGGTFQMGNGTITVSGTGTTSTSPFRYTSGTIVSEGSTIVVSGTGAAIDFYSGGYTLNNVTYSGDNTFRFVENLDITMGILTLDSTAGDLTCTLNAGNTYTISSLVAVGSSGKEITINSDSAGTKANFSDSSGTNTCDYLILVDNNATGGATWISGANSTKSNTTGWDPSAGTNMLINIGDSWKSVSSLQINIGDTWKPVTKVQINIGDTWKSVF